MKVKKMKNEFKCELSRNGLNLVIFIPRALSTDLNLKFKDKVKVKLVIE